MLSIIYVGWSICYILYRLLYLIYHWCIVVFLWSSFELDIICSRHAPYCLTCVLHSSYSLKMYKMVIVVLDRACFLNLRQKIFETFCDFATLLETLAHLWAEFCISIKYKFRFNVSSCVYFLPLPNKKRLVTTRSDRRAAAMWGQFLQNSTQTKAAGQGRMTWK